MYKPNSLRRHLTAAVPEPARDPDKLSILVRGGHVVCAGEASLSFEYRYTLQLVMLDYAGQADAITLPVLVWLRTHQPEHFDNPTWREKHFRFDVEYNDSRTIDLLIELELTERVLVQPTQPGRYQVDHVGEPERPGTLDSTQRWEFFLRDQLLATWNYDPRELDQATRLDT